MQLSWGHGYLDLSHRDALEGSVTAARGGCSLAHLLSQGTYEKAAPHLRSHILEGQSIILWTGG